MAAKKKRTTKRTKKPSPKIDPAAILKIDQEKARKELAALKKKYQAAEKKARSYVKKNPGKSMLIAAGIGAALGAGVTALVARGKKKSSTAKKTTKRKKR